LYGLPAAALAGAVPWLAEPLMFPTRVGVRWVDLVARAASAVDVDPWVEVMLWALWILLSFGSLVIGAASIWAPGPQPDKNRGRHDSAPT
jgi:hypothetical protein